MTALALTDHGSMAGIPKFWFACRSEGVKPLLGCEMYFVDDVGAAVGGRPNHGVVIARNQTGWRNLTKLSTASFVKGLSGKLPRIDWAMLKKYRKGLLVSGACIQGRIAQCLMAGDDEGARDYHERMQDTVDGDFLVEFIPLIFGDQLTLNKRLYDFITSEKAKAIVTNDAHYISGSQRDMYPLLVLAQTYGRLDSEVQQAWLKTRSELCETIRSFYGDIPRSFFTEAMDRTVEVAAACTTVELDTDPKYPEVEGD